MAVPKSKTSKSVRGMRRSHDYLSLANISFNSITGEAHCSHRMSNDGIYQNKTVLKNEKKKWY